MTINVANFEENASAMGSDLPHILPRLPFLICDHDGDLDYVLDSITIPRFMKLMTCRRSQRTKSDRLGKNSFETTMENLLSDRGGRIIVTI